MAARVADIDVLLQEKKDDIPCCPHGPALLFVKYGGDEDSQKRFYACSAFRDRKECNFFQWEDEKMTDIKRKNREEVNESMQPKFTHHEFRERFSQFQKLPVEKRTFCETCGLFLLKEERKWHKGQGHNLKTSITEEMCQKPSKLFLPLENNKTYAQYLFAESAVKFTLKVLNDLDISHVLCVGAPRIHESIMESNKMKTLLLDLDHRYQQIYSPEQFCRYNMFNHHFFDGGKSEDVFKKFVKETGKSNVAMVIDPPFGGMVEALAASINSIITTWRQESNKTESDSLPVLWYFPYFMEARITECLPEFSMLDYKVDYDNHGLFRGDTKKYGSPVRIFTNVSPEHIILPEVEGYWFCKLCQRYSAKENVHCQMCDSCTSKDGRTYKHCFKCGRCNKPSKIHCDKCNTCVQKDHKCGTFKPAGCHICGALDHKRKQCPQRQWQTTSNTQKRKLSEEDKKRNSPKKKKKNKTTKNMKNK